jgi:hypothetical protein
VNVVGADDQITVKQAYLSMFEYLSRYYDRGLSDEIGIMLGGLSLLQDGGSADPAAWEDFLESASAVAEAEISGGYDAVRLRLRP